LHRVSRQLAYFSIQNHLFIFSLELNIWLHQWYWSYQYADFLNEDNDNIEFDSYLIPEDDLEQGQLRMLEVDNRVIVPELTHIRFILTAADYKKTLSKF